MPRSTGCLPSGRGLPTTSCRGHCGQRAKPNRASVAIFPAPGHASKGGCPDQQHCDPKLARGADAQAPPRPAELPALGMDCVCFR